ncbi:accessory Sec system translocase SecA2 [Pseudonocardiaceae bacterium YIM PH 21723]|nr:accessory Sec system translocase SecA2 [Pseudonocardiaceae bacterium YIM PH 21723]
MRASHRQSEPWKSFHIHRRGRPPDILVSELLYAFPAGGHFPHGRRIVRRFAERIRRFMQRPGTVDLGRAWPVVRAATAAEDSFRGLTDAAIQAELARLRRTDGAAPARDESIAFCALAREVARRTLGQRPFDVQLLAVASMLSGRVVEMATGEGKTLVGAITAAGFVLRGRSVHVVAMNDYLARRDAEWMRPLLTALGASVAWIDQHSDDDARRTAYRADVTYAPVAELGFDVLRDRMRVDPAELVVPIPDVALVDEVDSVLVDEARVPLVLAGSTELPRPDPVVTEVVAGLREQTDYEVDDERRNVHLTEAGLDRVEQALGGVDLYLGENVALLTEVNLALHARALLVRDVDYLVRDDSVKLISASRGRIARLQRWPDGLQAAVEAKERVPSSPAGEILDSMIVQALISRYATICGMSGTAVAISEQLWEFYELHCGRIDTNVPCVRDDEPDRLHLTAADKLEALVQHVRERYQAGQPVLVGTRSVAESEEVAGALELVGVPGVVLNARNDAEEALIVSRAGEAGRVTISTQMTGRGTDIRLGGADGVDHDRVAGLGGLRVVGFGRYHTGRLDDQLRGRAGRQGDPGSSVFFTSLEDEIVRDFVPGHRPPTVVDGEGVVHDGLAQMTVDHAQRVAEGAHLDTQRTTWCYHQLIGIQRAAVLEHRDDVLHRDAAVELLRTRRPERYAEAVARVGEAVVAGAARSIVLHHLDRIWVDHLAYLDEIREGIHLRALAREAPLHEFHRIATEEFPRLLPAAHDAAEATFAEAEIGPDGVDLESLGLRRPNSTWTYMITDNPYGTPEERFLEYIGAGLRDGAVRLGLRH